MSPSPQPAGRAGIPQVLHGPAARGDQQEGPAHPQHPVGHTETPGPGGPRNAQVRVEGEGWWGGGTPILGITHPNVTPAATTNAPTRCGNGTWRGRTARLWVSSGNGGVPSCPRDPKSSGGALPDCPIAPPDLFVGQLKSCLKCQACGYRSTTFEVFCDLSLPIPKVGPQKPLRPPQIPLRPPQIPLRPP